MVEKERDKQGNKNIMDRRTNVQSELQSKCSVIIKIK